MSFLSEELIQAAVFDLSYARKKMNLEGANRRGNWQVKGTIGSVIAMAIFVAVMMVILQGISDEEGRVREPNYVLLVALILLFHIGAGVAGWFTFGYFDRVHSRNYEKFESAATELNLQVANQRVYDSHELYGVLPWIHTMPKDIIPGSTLWLAGELDGTTAYFVQCMQELQEQKGYLSVLLLRSSFAVIFPDRVDALPDFLILPKEDAEWQYFEKEFHSGGMHTNVMQTHGVATLEPDRVNSVLTQQLGQLIQSRFTMLQILNGRIVVVTNIRKGTVWSAIPESGAEVVAEIRHAKAIRDLIVATVHR